VSDVGIRVDDLPKERRRTSPSTQDTHLSEPKHARSRWCALRVLSEGAKYVDQSLGYDTYSEVFDSQKLVND